MSIMSNSFFSLDGRTPMEQVTGETPDISEYLDFGFYDWVWYKDIDGLRENHIGWWLMSYWILTEAGHMIACTMVEHTTNLELTTEEVNQQCQQYDQQVIEVLNNANHNIPHGDDIILQDWNDYPVETEPDFVVEFHNVVSDDWCAQAAHV